MPSSPRLSDAEDLALRTMWRSSGFVDSSSRTFQHRSRLYQWRVNGALIIALCFLSLCWFAPDWLMQQLDVRGNARDWFAQYVMLRVILSFACLVLGLYCWLRLRNLLWFWIGFTLFAGTMWGLDRWLLAVADADGIDVGSPIVWPLRATLIVIGLVNIWRHAFAPLPTQRQLLAWRPSRQA